MIDDGSSTDKPLAFHWRAMDEGWIDALALPAAQSRAYEQARASILLEAMITARSAPESWISYSRCRNWYSQGQRYRSTAYRFSTVPKAMDELERLGLLEHDRARPGRFGRQSSFRAVPALVQVVALPAVLYDPGEIIRLKDKDESLIGYRDTNDTIRMRRGLASINEALRVGNIGIRRVVGQIATIDGAYVNLGQDQLHRIFNRGRFSLGGRLYGVFWQNMPKRVRPDLTLDGERTHESDYAQLHPRLLYAEAGAVLEGDAYDLDGWERKLVKRAFNIAVNAETEAAAVRAIAQKIGGEGAYAKARELLEAIKARHRPIAGCFGSGAGLRLQRRDADLAERVVLRLLDRGIVTLPIHDSFVVQARHAPVRDEIMDDELQKLLAKLAPAAKNIVAPGAYIKSVLHNGTGALVPPPCPRPFPLVLVAGRPFFFGGLAPFALPVSLVSAWAGGVAPLLVRAAPRHEIVARGLTQGRLAREVALSRPQLTKLLGGRSGTSPEVALRLKTFLLAA
jgi:hypothetical protein